MFTTEPQIIPELDHLSGSWIIVNTQGEAVYELYNRSNVEKVAAKRPDLTILTAYEYLSNLDMNRVNLEQALYQRLHHRSTAQAT